MLIDQDRTRIRPLDDKSGFRLWKIRVTAAIEGEGRVTVLYPFGVVSSFSAKIDSGIKALRRQASNIMLNALSDQALKALRSVIGSTQELLTKLDSPYNSKCAASKIFELCEMVLYELHQYQRQHAATSEPYGRTDWTTRDNGYDVRLSINCHTYGIHKHRSYFPSSSIHQHPFHGYCQLKRDC